MKPHNAGPGEPAWSSKGARIEPHLLWGFPQSPRPSPRVTFIWPHTGKGHRTAPSAATGPRAPVGSTAGRTASPTHRSSHTATGCPVGNKADGTDVNARGQDRACAQGSGSHRRDSHAGFGATCGGGMWTVRRVHRGGVRGRRVWKRRVGSFSLAIRAGGCTAVCLPRLFRGEATCPGAVPMLYKCPLI